MIDDLLGGVALHKTDPTEGTVIVYDIVEVLVQHLPLFGSKHWSFILLNTDAVETICAFITDVIHLINSASFKQLDENERGNYTALTYFVWILASFCCSSLCSNIAN